MAEKYHTDFGSFYLFYLSQHMRVGTRAFHYVGTWIAFLVLGAIVADQFLDFLGMGNWRWALILPAYLQVYVLGFLSHWTIEKNQPATFVYPLYSIGGDLVMFKRITTRQIKKDVETVRDRLNSGWAVDRFGFYPPDHARKHKIVTDRRLVSYVAKTAA